MLRRPGKGLTPKDVQVFVSAGARHSRPPAPGWATGQLGVFLNSFLILLNFFLYFFFLFSWFWVSRVHTPLPTGGSSPANCASRPKLLEIHHCRVAAAQGLPSRHLPAWGPTQAFAEAVPREGTCPHLGHAASLPWGCRKAPLTSCHRRTAPPELPGTGWVAAVRGRGPGSGRWPPAQSQPALREVRVGSDPSWLRHRLPCPAWLRGGRSDPRFPLHFGVSGGWSQPQGRKRLNKPLSSPKSRIDQRDVRRAPPEGWLPAQRRGAPVPFCPLQSRGSVWHKWGRGPEKRPQMFFCFFGFFLH